MSGFVHRIASEQDSQEFGEKVVLYTGCRTVYCLLIRNRYEQSEHGHETSLISLRTQHIPTIVHAGLELEVIPAANVEVGVGIAFVVDRLCAHVPTIASFVIQ